MGKLIIKLFIKDHENTKDPAVRERYGKCAGIVGILSNLLLCIIKVLFGLTSRSIAVIADGINNLADASSSIITLVGFKLASQPEDEEHPYGHARIEYLTGLFVSLFIIVIGFQLLKTSADKIVHPESVEFSWLTVIILVIAMLVKLWQAFFNTHIGRTINSTTLAATAADSRNDVIATGAVLASFIVGKVTGVQIDGYMGCLVALFIIWSGAQLIRETSSPLLGEAPDRELVDSIRDIVMKEPSVVGIHDLMVHNYGPGRIFASIHIEVDAGEDLMTCHDIIDNLERIVKESLDIEFVAHMDPIKTDDPLINRMRAVISDAFAQFDGIDSIHDFRIVPGPSHTNVIFDIVLAAGCVMTRRDIYDIAYEAIAPIEAESAADGEKKYYLIITFDKAYTKLGGETKL